MEEMFPNIKRHKIPEALQRAYTLVCKQKGVSLKEMRFCILRGDLRLLDTLGRRTGGGLYWNFYLP